MKKIIALTILLLLCSCTSVYQDVLKNNYTTLDNCQKYLEDEDAPSKPVLLLQIKTSKMAVKEALTDKYGKAHLPTEDKVGEVKGEVKGGVSNEPLIVQIKQLYITRDYYNNKIEALKKEVK